MKIFIVEDEKAALNNLKALISEINPKAEIIGESDTVCNTIEWFKSNAMPDLVIMDIHLADGSAFEIFDYVDITCPIIFTTAYDEYALRAFKVNSIDYLLKPINKDELRNAFAKYELLFNGNKTKDEDDSLIRRIIGEIKKENNYKTHFLIPVKGDKFIPLEVDSIMLIYISEGIVKAVDNDNNQYVFSQTLDELTEMLNPKLFFRANRQFLVSKKAIRDVSIWFNGRLVLNLKNNILIDERIIVSKARASDFKEWF